MKGSVRKNSENTPECIINSSKQWYFPFFSGPIFFIFFLCEISLFGHEKLFCTKWRTMYPLHFGHIKIWSGQLRKNCENTPNCIIWASKSWCSPFFSGHIFSYFFCTKCHFLDMKNYSVRNGGPCTRYIFGIYKYEVTVGWPYGAHHCLYNLGVYRLVCLFYNFTGFKHILWRFCTIWPHLFPAPDMFLETWNNIEKRPQKFSV